ncbi:MAG: hypothetical protein JXO72_05765 [Vicinamibacteria bacterium]|nr:hypothetical protein [Vicinamibacteria bacterium]
MLDESVVSAGLKLNELAKLESGAGVILLTIKDAGKSTRGITYSDLYYAVQHHLAQRLKRYSVSDPETIVDTLLKYLRDYQSVFTMAAR